jgi:hypothetical protein
VSIGDAGLTNRILGCAFVDWRGRALKVKQTRAIMFGELKIFLGKNEILQHMRCTVDS